MLGLDDNPLSAGELLGVNVTKPGEHSVAGSSETQATKVLAELMSTKEVGVIKAGTKGSPGEFMGDGLAPVPARIADRIGKGEFIEMYEITARTVV